jgi:hypothetical protein
MSTIVTRSGKGSPLSHVEVDANFTNLNTDKIQSGNTVAALTITSATVTDLAVTGITSFDGAQGTAGQVLTSAGTGATPTWATPAAGTVTSVGGTGTVNGITLTGTVTSSGNLTLGGTLSNVSLATQVTGNLPVTNLGSGTGATSSTFWRGDGSWASVSASTATNLAGGALGSVPYQLLSGTTVFLAGNTTTTPQFITSTGVAGVATAPTYTSSTGSGNVVLATSPTLVTPALGTPASGVVTNLTGTASININGTVGATTPAAGTFTSLSDSGNLTFTGTGNRITGDMSNATLANRIAFQSSTTNGVSVLSLLPNGTGTTSGIACFANTDPTNTSYALIADTAGQVSFRAAISGTGTYEPMTMYTGGSERLRIDTSGNVGIGTSSPGTRLQIGNPSDANQALRFDFTDSSTARINSTRVGAGNLQSLQLAGQDTVQFVSNGTERMRIDSSGNVKLSTANTSILNSSGNPILRQTGSVLQVVSTTLKSNVSTTSTTATNLTGMSVTITPTSTSSKILIQATLNVSIGGQKRIYFTVTGGNAASYIGDAGTGVECAAAFCSRVNEDYVMGTTPLLYLDSPATTSAVTYQIQWWIETGSTAYLNRPVNLDANGANQASTITVMEIAA